MKKALFALLVLLGPGAAYLAFAPVPIEPESWETSPNPGFTDDFAPNKELANLERIELPNSPGPEDAAVLDGMIYATSQVGDITRIDPETGAVEIVAKTGGVPLGIEIADNRLYIADAHKGLLSLTADGTLKILTDSVDGTPILYADDLDIAQDGIIYFSDASTKFGAEAHGSTMAASLLEIIEGVGTGRVLAYDPATEETRIIADNLVFANGVSIHPDGDIACSRSIRKRAR